jgi:hypothetical protein
MPPLQSLIGWLVAESEDVRRRLESNERIARQYLAKHEPQFPKYFDLPSTDWHYVPNKVELVPKGPQGCGVRAREDANDGPVFVPGTLSFNEVQCARPQGHDGDHVSSCRKVPLMHVWKIVSWSP